MLDLPELLAPAKIVRGLTSMLCSCAIDLNPATVIRVMPAFFPASIVTTQVPHAMGKGAPAKTASMAPSIERPCLRIVER